VIWLEGEDVELSGHAENHVRGIATEPTCASHYNQRRYL
jgi:hypothetical protein